MKCLTVRQPWASLIMHGHKWIETRPHRTHYRGPLAIHAGLSFAGDAWDSMLPAPSGVSPANFLLMASMNLRGVVLGQVTVVDCLPIVEAVPICDFPAEPDRVVQVMADDPNRCCVLDRWPDGGEIHRQAPDQLALGDFSPGRWAWILEKPMVLREPLAGRGRQGLWNWHPEAGS